MIRYDLSCDNGHAFEGWFGSADDFDHQQKMSLVSCPVCGSTHVAKRLMAPSVSTARKKERRQEMVMQAGQKEMVAKLREIVSTIRPIPRMSESAFPRKPARSIMARPNSGASSARQRWTRWRPPGRGCRDRATPGTA